MNTNSFATDFIFFRLLAGWGWSFADSKPRPQQATPINVGNTMC